MTDATATKNSIRSSPTSRVDGARGRIVEGADAIRRLVRVDQKPIGRTPRSNLATYTGLFDHVRKLFAATPDSARSAATTQAAFRSTSRRADARPATAKGSSASNCCSCRASMRPVRPATAPLQRADAGNRYRERSIADVLAMTVEEACEFFADEAQVQRALEALQDVGLGYLRLGQPATELSGGEAQRIKLATELQRAQRGDTLYMLDEPTTGLHPADVDRLMTQLQGLVDAGNTVIVVEHDMRVVAR